MLAGMKKTKLTINQQFASNGGKARAKKLSKKRRKEISVKANKARWSKEK